MALDSPDVREKIALATRALRNVLEMELQDLIRQAGSLRTSLTLSARDPDLLRTAGEVLQWAYEEVRRGRRGRVWRGMADENAPHQTRSPQRSQQEQPIAGSCDTPLLEMENQAFADLEVPRKAPCRSPAYSGATQTVNEIPEPFSIRRTARSAAQGQPERSAEDPPTASNSEGPWYPRVPPTRQVPNPYPS
jgi:hypothetical protein